MASSVFDIKEHVIPAAHIREYARAISTSQDDTLLLHVKQYTPKDNPNPKKGDLTIIGGHANGFPKELYEPLWEEFYHQTQKKNIRIRSIWIADAAWQGQSSLLNANKLGDDPSWLDYTRDILQLINTFRPPAPIFAMGHSFGGNALTNLALLHPRLLNSLILLDPVISRHASSPGDPRYGPAGMSIHRRDVWPSREEAAASFAKSPFYRAWDPRVLQLWIRHGLRNVDDSSNGKEVTLATTKHQEVFTYLRPTWKAFDPEGKTLINRDLVPDLDTSLPKDALTWPAYRPEAQNTISRLANLRPSVLYVFGGKSDLSPQEFCDEKMQNTGVGLGGSGGAKVGRVKSVTGKEYGHLIPMEDPRFCAEHAAEWAEIELERWWKGEREYEQWAKKSLKEKSTISEEYASRLGRPGRDQNKTKAKI